MRYDYRCENCGAVREFRHGMLEAPSFQCQECQGRMRKIIGVPAMIHVTGSGLKGRSLLKRDRPSNREYSAYKAWERSGGEADSPLRDDFLRAKGELPE